jgi:molecular chaperone Hsp33
MTAEKVKYHSSELAPPQRSVTLPDVHSGDHASRTDDLVQPFQLDPFALRGRLVRLGPTVDRILAQHDYPEPVAALLGEAITLAVMLAGALKYDGVFTLQTKSDGPVRLLVADVKTDGAVRGYAQYDAKRLGEIVPGDTPEGGYSPSVPDLLGTGYIAFTVDQGDDTERYQGIVEIVGATLAECAQHYFRQSEQLQAGLKLAVARAGAEGSWRAGGLMVQRVPPEGGHTPIGDDVEDAWRRVMVLMSSATPTELVAPDLPPRRLLWRLFHDEEVRVYDTHPVEARCRCSRERIAGILRAFPADEIDEMRKEAVTTVTCEFCNTRYEFAAEDLERLAQA